MQTCAVKLDCGLNDMLNDACIISSYTYILSLNGSCMDNVYTLENEVVLFQDVKRMVTVNLIQNGTALLLFVIVMGIQLMRQKNARVFP